MEPQISIDTLKQTVGVVNQMIPIFIWGLTGLSVAVVSMAVYIVKMQNKIASLTKESTTALTKSIMVIESNTKSHDRIYEYLIKNK